MKKLKLRCICRPTDYDMTEVIAEKIRSNFRIGKTYFASRQTGNPDSWDAAWTLIHFTYPFDILKDVDCSKKGRGYYYTPGIPGLWFTDKMHKLEVRDTRRNSDWDKLHDKRVVRRMFRQMAKNFAGATELHSARNHKR